MEQKGLGGKQELGPHDSFDISHWNFALECRREDEKKLKEVFERVSKELKFTFEEVGNGPTRSIGKYCIHCGQIIHAMAIDCHHCKKQI